MMHTIGQVARRSGLARSSLIYYDKLGVLEPSGRSAANYRLYSDGDLERLDRILLLRSAGLPLQAIAGLLETADNTLNASLERRLSAINGEIQALRNQQRVILKIMENERLGRDARLVTKATWVSILRAAGLDDDGMRDWHRAFERTSPEAHQDFLESIGIGPEESAKIREWSR